VSKGETRILLVDDDLDYLWLLHTHLRLKGYQVLIAANGPNALYEASTQAPSLVIMDVQMPGMDGYTVCQRIREFSNVPIILLSGLSAPAAIVRGLDAGADHYMTKPVHIEELLIKAGALLQRTDISAQPAHQVITAAPGLS
jgi:DNA-binding response OmpR family regulator